MWCSNPWMSPHCHARGFQGMKHALSPTERALQGGCITKPFTENKKPGAPANAG